MTDTMTEDEAREIARGAIEICHVMLRISREVSGNEVIRKFNTLCLNRLLTWEAREGKAREEA